MTEYRSSQDTVRSLHMFLPHAQRAAVVCDDDCVANRNFHQNQHQKKRPTKLSYAVCNFAII